MQFTQDVENQMQQESETARDQISSLEDQLQAERHRRDDAEMEVAKQKQVPYSPSESEIDGKCKLQLGNKNVSKRFLRQQTRCCCLSQYTNDII